MSDEIQRYVNELLTWEQVYAWARKQPGVVGIPQSSFVCPHGRYLDEATGDPHWLVGGQELACGEEGAAQLPQWAREVIHEVDQYDCDEIEAALFLEILEHSRPNGEISA